jgi:hypothetical protein
MLRQLRLKTMSHILIPNAAVSDIKLAYGRFPGEYGGSDTPSKSLRHESGGVMLVRSKRREVAGTGDSP